MNETSWRAHHDPSLLGAYPLPVAVGAIQIVGTHLAGLRQPDRMDLDAFAVLLLAAGPVALVLRRRYPVAILGFVLATTLGYLLLDYPRGRPSWR